MADAPFFADLVGQPFCYGGRGPAYDCYGLVMEMSRRGGVLLPEFGFADNAQLAAAMMGASLPAWRECAPATGAVVLLRVGRLVSHVGYLLGEDRMIHCWQQSHGVSVARLYDWKHRIVGFYRHGQH